MYYPTCDDAFLNAVVFSLKKRSKAIRHRDFDIACERLREKNGDDLLEMIEIELTRRVDGGVQKFKLSVWAERWLWIHAGQGGKERWGWSREGRLLGADQARRVISAVEETISASVGMDASQTELFDSIWQPLLARGPEGLKQGQR